MHGAASVRIHNPSAKSEALPSRLLLDLDTDTPSRSRPEALDFFDCPRRLAFREPAAVDVCRCAGRLRWICCASRRLWIYG
jgi:hypothetical protein